MQVQFLGSGDAFGSGGRLQTCILLVSEGFSLLLDCGTSALIGMRRFAIEPNAVDAILLTHLHGDHFGGIPFFLLDAQLVSKRIRPLRIAGPPGLEERIRSAREVLFPRSSQIAPAFELTFEELGRSLSVPVGPALVSAYPVVHPSGAPPFALRVTCAGKTVVYSGDTEWTDSLLEAATGADLFICESYTYQKRIPFHLSYATLSAHRPELDCERIVLTHMGSEMLAHREGVGVELAHDGLILQV